VARILKAGGAVAEIVCQVHEGQVKRLGRLVRFTVRVAAKEVFDIREGIIKDSMSVEYR